ncbi:N-acylneuraminate cytidylyltransferase, partial [Bienertia sinuspersici]
MDYIRENPDCKGKDLNEHLYSTYGLYMKKSSLYNLKAYVTKHIFGGHDKSYSLLPCYGVDLALKAVWPIAKRRELAMPPVHTHLKRQWRGFKRKWTKHKFDPRLCCDTNISNFVESFNSTLGVDRCKPGLTLLEAPMYHVQDKKGVHGKDCNN